MIIPQRGLTVSNLSKSYKKRVVLRCNKRKIGAQNAEKRKIQRTVWGLLRKKAKFLSFQQPKTGKKG